MDVMEFEDIPTMKINSRQLKIQTSFASINYGDIIRRRRGLFDDDSYVLGFEGVGIITEVGNRVVKYKIGQRVAFLTPRGGGYSTEIIVNEENAFIVPEGVSDEQASCALCVGGTASLLIHESQIESGDVVVVHGASGGVGSILCQILNLYKVTVIGIVSSVTKVNYLDKIGIKHIINRQTNDNLDKVIMDITENKGVKAVYDCVGNATKELNFKILKKRGIWMYYGSVSGHSLFEGQVLLMNSINLKGFVVFDYIGSEIWKKKIIKLFSLIANGSITIPIDSVLPLNEFRQAHMKVETGNIHGKVLLQTK